VEGRSVAGTGLWKARGLCAPPGLPSANPSSGASAKRLPSHCAAVPSWHSAGWGSGLSGFRRARHRGREHVHRLTASKVVETQRLQIWRSSQLRLYQVWTVVVTQASVLYNSRFASVCMSSTDLFDSTDQWVCMQFDTGTDINEYVGRHRLHRYRHCHQR
jgi:hypothetical protein